MDRWIGLGGHGRPASATRAGTSGRSHPEVERGSATGTLIPWRTVGFAGAASPLRTTPSRTARTAAWRAAKRRPRLLRSPRSRKNRSVTTNRPKASGSNPRRSRRASPHGVPYVPLNQPVPVAVPGPPRACAKCGSPLYAQWWSPTKGGYECRRCGALTKGAPPAGALQSGAGCFLGCAGVVALLAVLAAVGGEFGGTVGLIAVAALIGLVGLVRTGLRRR